MLFSGTVCAGFGGTGCVCVCDGTVFGYAVKWFVTGLFWGAGCVMVCFGVRGCVCVL